MTTDPSHIDNFIPRKHPTVSDPREAFANFKASDLVVMALPFTEKDKDELARELARVCGLTWDAMLPDTRIRARKQARYVINNVTMAEARMGLEALTAEPKDKAWWEKNGKVGGVARCIVDEVGRIRSQAGKDDRSRYLADPEDDPEWRARDEAKRRRYLRDLE